MDSTGTLQQPEKMFKEIFNTLNYVYFIVCKTADDKAGTKLLDLMNEFNTFTKKYEELISMNASLKNKLAVKDNKISELESILAILKKNEKAENKKEEDKKQEKNNINKNNNEEIDFDKFMKAILDLAEKCF